MKVIVFLSLLAAGLSVAACANTSTILRADFDPAFEIVAGADLPELPSGDQLTTSDCDRGAAAITGAQFLIGGRCIVEFTSRPFERGESDQDALYLISGQTFPAEGGTGAIIYFTGETRTDDFLVGNDELWWMLWLRDGSYWFAPGPTMLRALNRAQERGEDLADIEFGSAGFRAEYPINETFTAIVRYELENPSGGFSRRRLYVNFEFATARGTQTWRQRVRARPIGLGNNATVILQSIGDGPALFVDLLQVQAISR
ncbi:MAG: hypothetical protein AAGA72_12370 [Pseudomonadota bacterium]